MTIKPLLKFDNQTGASPPKLEERTPGSVAYYGGLLWDKFRVEAQSSLEPYVFGGDLN
jgi:hypothetical protein